MQDNIIWNSLFTESSPKAAIATPKTPMLPLKDVLPSMLTPPVKRQVHTNATVVPTIDQLLLDASYLPVYDSFEQANFELLEELGRGAFGSVWRARRRDGSSSGGGEFAAKKFNIKRQEARNAFVRELAAQVFIASESRQFCQRAAVCGTTAFIVKNDSQSTAVIVYPFVVAGDLAHLIENWPQKTVSNKENIVTDAKKVARQQIIDLSTLIQLGADILRNIAEMHRNNIAHRDIKPENVLIYKNQREHSTFIDFGSACFVSYSSEFQRQLQRLFDRVEKQIGPVDRDFSCVPVDTTLLYIDPKLASMDAVDDPKEDFRLGKQADLFAAAVVLFEMFLEKRAITLLKSKNPLALIEWRPDTALLLREKSSSSAAENSPLRKAYSRLAMLLDSMLANDDSIDVYAEQLTNIGELLLK